MSIHSTDPFATPGGRRSPVRQLRGRLAAAVTLWTASRSGTGQDRFDWAGLTVSSTLVADGRPGRLLGLLDDESDLWAAVSGSGRFAVTPLAAGDQRLADTFAGLMPAPGGLFRDDGWTATPYGPVPAGRDTWAGCELTGTRPFGHGLLAEAVIAHVSVGPDAEPLVHYRGRYRRLGAARGL